MLALKNLVSFDDLLYCSRKVVASSAIWNLQYPCLKKIITRLIKGAVLVRHYAELFEKWNDVSGVLSY